MFYMELNFDVVELNIVWVLVLDMFDVRIVWLFIVDGCMINVEFVVCLGVVLLMVYVRLCVLVD